MTLCLQPFHRSVLAGVTSIEDLEAVAAPLKTATKTLAARATEAGLHAAATDVLDSSKDLRLDSLVDGKVCLFYRRVGRVGEDTFKKYLRYKIKDTPPCILKIR